MSTIKYIKIVAKRRVDVRIFATTHIGVFDKPGDTSSSCRENRLDALVGTGGGDTTVRTGWRNIVRNRYAVSGRENHEQTEYSRPTTVVCESHKSRTENVRNGKKNVHLPDGMDGRRREVRAGTGRIMMRARRSADSASSTGGITKKKKKTEYFIISIIVPIVRNISRVIVPRRAGNETRRTAFIL